jgi:hypothetical protein
MMKKGGINRLKVMLITDHIQLTAMMLTWNITGLLLNTEHKLKSGW